MKKRRILSAFLMTAILLSTLLSFPIAISADEGGNNDHVLQNVAYRETNYDDFWPNYHTSFDIWAGKKYEIEIQYKATDNYLIFLNQEPWGRQTGIIMDENYGNYLADKTSLWDLDGFSPGEEHIGKPLDAILLPVTGDEWIVRKYAFESLGDEGISIVIADEGGVGGGEVWINYVCVREIDSEGNPFGTNVLLNGGFDEEITAEDGVYGWGQGLGYPGWDKFHWSEVIQTEAPVMPDYVKYYEETIQKVAYRETNTGDFWPNFGIWPDIESDKKYEITIQYKSTDKFLLFWTQDPWGNQTGMIMDENYGDYSADKSIINEDTESPSDVILFPSTEGKWITRKYAFDFDSPDEHVGFIFVDQGGVGGGEIWINYFCIREIDSNGSPTGYNKLTNGGYQDGTSTAWTDGLGHWWHLIDESAPRLPWYVAVGTEVEPEDPGDPGDPEDPDAPVFIQITGATNLDYNVLYGLGTFDISFTVAAGHTGVKQIEVEYTVYDEYRNAQTPTESIIMDLPGSARVISTVNFTPVKYGYFPLIYNVYNLDDDQRTLLTTKEIWLSVTKEDELTPKLASSDANELTAQQFAGQRFYRLNSAEIVSGSGANENYLNNMYNFYMNSIVASNHTALFMFQDVSHCTQAVAEAVAEKFKGLGMRYEIVNEPDIARGSITEEQYVELVKQMSDWIKAIDDTAIIIGPGPVSIVNNQGFAFADRCFAMMVDKYGEVIWDEFSFHDYEGHMTLTTYHYKYMFSKIYEVLEKYGLEDMPLVVTERGFTNKSWAGWEGGVALDVNGQMISELLRQNLLEAGGVQPDQKNYYYALEHGFEAYPSYFVSRQGVISTGLALRNRAQQLRITAPTEVFDFGETGNKLFVGSRYNVNGNDILELFNTGDNYMPLKLTVSGGDTLLIADHYGNESYLNVENGEVTLSVPRTPIYVKASDGQIINVVPVDYGTNYALGAAVTYEGENSPITNNEKLTDGILQVNNPNGYGGAIWQVDIKNYTYVPYLTLDFGDEIDMDKIIVYHHQADNGYSTLFEYDIEYWNGSEWVFLKKVTNENIIPDPMEMGIYHFHEWKNMLSTNVVNLNNPITTSQIRIKLIDASWGFLVSQAELDYTGGGMWQAVTLREIEVYNTGEEYIPTEVSFEAEQVGGVSGTADSTGIKITFNQSVTGLTANNIIITDSTGAMLTGTLSGNGSTYTITLNGLKEEGTVTVNISDFGDYTVGDNVCSVTVYKKTVQPSEPFDQSYPFAMCSNGNMLTNSSYAPAMLDAGATMVRLDASFPSIRPNATTWNWSTLDNMRTLREENPDLYVLPILGYGAAWAYESDSSPISGAEIMPASSPENIYGNFVYETVSRYKDVTKYWESWNEPDLDWSFPSTSGADFFKYQKAFYLAAKEADPDCVVLFAGVSYASIEGYLGKYSEEEGYFVPSPYPPERSFFEDYLIACLNDPDAAANNYYFDIMNQHTYSRATDCYDYIEANKKMMMDYLGEIKPIWITEMGASVGGRDAFNCTMDEYCDYILQSFAWGSMAGVEKFFHFQLDNSNGHGLYDGMLGDPRPALYTYRDVLVAEFSDVSFSKQLYGTKGVLLEGHDLWNNTEDWRAGYNAFEFLNDAGSKRVVMAFADTANDIDVKIPATPGATAIIIDRNNVRQSIEAVNGYYELTLAGTTNIAGWPFWDSSLGEYENSIGGATMVIVEQIPQAPVEPQKLQAPQGLAFVGFIAQWGSVENAIGYDVHLLKDNVEIKTYIVYGTSYDLEEDIKQYGNGTYGFTVRAIGDDTQYTNSEMANVSIEFEYSESQETQKLSTPQGLTFSNFTAQWGSVENAIGYDVHLLKDNVKVESYIVYDTSYDFNEDIKQNGDGIYTFVVKAIGDGVQYANSEMSNVSNRFIYNADPIDPSEPNKIKIATNELPDGVVGTKYNSNINVTGKGIITYRIINGKLPTGLTLNNTTGLISGTPTEVGIYIFTIQISNGTMTDSKELSINIMYVPQKASLTNVMPMYGVSKHTVIFANTGDTPIASQILDHGAKVIQPDDPVREGYKFMGWYYDSNNLVRYNFNKRVTIDITLYAKWKKV